MTEPSTECPKGTPTVSLAGKEWPVPELAVRQFRTIRPPLIEMNERLTGVTRDKIMGAFNALNEADFDRLVIKPVLIALTRAHPNFDEKEVEDWVVRNDQWVVAWFTVREQSGVFLSIKRAITDGEGGEAPAQGEAPAPAETAQA